MAMFKRMFKKFLGFYEENSEEMNITDNNTITSYDSEPKRVNRNNSNIMNIIKDEETPEIKKTKEIVLYPKTFGDACEVVEHIEQGFMVIVNMDDVDIDTCKRITDFVLGAIYVLEGDVEKISKKVFRFFLTK